MRRIIGALFLVLMFAGLVPVFARFGYAWIGPHFGAPLLVFERTDSKLFLLIGFLAVTPVLWALFPQLFARRENHSFSFRQALAIGVTIAGLLSLTKVLFGGDYLATARSFAEARGYIACPMNKFGAWDKALMVTNLNACREPDFLWPIFESEA